MFLDNILRLFRKEFNLYAFNLKEDTKHLIQFSNKEADSIFYLQKLLDSKIKGYCPHAKDENNFINDFLKNREHSYIIENSEFNEVEYIKNNALKIYKKYLSKK